jgi:hypothetical protein
MSLTWPVASVSGRAGSAWSATTAHSRGTATSIPRRVAPPIQAIALAGRQGCSQGWVGFFEPRWAPAQKSVRLIGDSISTASLENDCGSAHPYFEVVGEPGEASRG